MKKSCILLGVLVLVFMPVALVVVGCQQQPTPSPTPAPTTESEIPANFTTYTSEGLFSISYPQDWAPATSIMGELEEEIKEWVKSIDPEAEVEETKLIFMAGMPDEEGYYPTVGISVAPRSAGYYTLDEIVESEDLWCREHLQRYHVHSQTRTFVDSREADILISEDYEPEFGVWRYLELTMVKDDFVWFVVCSSESEDFNDYEDTFNSVVRSIRILD